MRFPNGDKHLIRNATASIKGILRPYWKGKTLSDQDWVLVLLQLKKIENVLKEAQNEDD